MITTAAFWKGAAERALKTFVQTFIAALLTMVGTIASAWDVPWLTSIWTALGLALMATFLSLATSVGNAGFTAGAVIVPGEVVEPDPERALED